MNLARKSNENTLLVQSAVCVSIGGLCRVLYTVLFFTCVMYYVFVYANYTVRVAQVHDVL